MPRAWSPEERRPARGSGAPPLVSPHARAIEIRPKSGWAKFFFQLGSLRKVRQWRQASQVLKICILIYTYTYRCIYTQRTDSIASSFIFKLALLNHESRLPAIAALNHSPRSKRSHSVGCSSSSRMSRAKAALPQRSVSCQSPLTAEESHQLL